MANGIDKLVASAVGGAIILIVVVVVLSQLDKVIGPTYDWRPIIVLLGVAGTVSFLAGLIKLFSK